MSSPQRSPFSEITSRPRTCRSPRPEGALHAHRASLSAFPGDHFTYDGTPVSSAASVLGRLPKDLGACLVPLPGTGGVQRRARDKPGDQDVEVALRRRRNRLPGVEERPRDRVGPGGRYTAKEGGPFVSATATTDEAGFLDIESGEDAGSVRYVVDLSSATVELTAPSL